ncbi:MAG: MFS transporter [Chloroflexota bacterium]|nr:MAG: MFS transporter [Chloroflexota bacterium]
MNQTEPRTEGGTYRRLVVIAATHAINDGAGMALIPLIPLLVSEFRLDTVQVGLLTATTSLAAAVLQMPASLVADHTGRRRTLLAAGLFLIALCYALYGIASGYAMLLALGLLLGIAGCAYHPSAMAIVAEQFSRARKGFFLSVHAAGANLGMALIPFVVGWSAHQWGWRVALGLMVVPTVLVAVLTLLSFREQRSTQVSLRGSLADVRSQVLRNPRLLVLGAVAGAHGAAYAGILPFLPLFLQQTYGWGTDALGLGQFILSGTGFLAQPLIGHLADRVGRLRVMALATLLVAILTALIPTLRIEWLVYPIFACLGVALFGIWPLMAATVTDFADRETISSAVGLNFTVGTLCSALAPPLSGALIMATSLSIGLYWGPALFLVALGFVLILMTLTRNRNRFSTAVGYPG